MSNVLIIGGAGYIGTHLAKRLVSDGHSTTIYDSLIYGSESLQRLDAILNKNISTSEALLIGTNSNQRFKNFEFVQGDIRETETLKRLLTEGKFEYVFHFGELVGTYGCAKNPVATEEINFRGTANVANLVARNGAVLIYNSSSSVYKATSDPTVLLSEDTELPPLTSLDDYCKNKVLAEHAIVHLRESSPEFRYVILRPATVGGLSPRMRLDLLPNQFTFGAMAIGKIHIDRPNDYRAVIDIDDIVDFYAGLLKSLPQNGIYNIGHHNMTKAKFVDQVAREIHPVQFQVLPSRVTHGDPRNLRISSEKLASATGFVATRNFRQTISPLAQLLQEHTRTFSPAFLQDNFSFRNMPLNDFLRMLFQ